MAAIDALQEDGPETIDESQWPEYSGYKPLNQSTKEIRLLRITQNSGEALPRCELLHQSLEDESQYHALSYHWGAPGETAAIMVDGIEVQIRRTLHCFLQRLTSHFNPITVWLDAICINQKDVAERNWQVQLMPEVYKNAQNVYAWLGEGDADCLFAMRYVRSSTNTMSEDPVGTAGLASECLQRLFLLPYWSRLWIIQEIVLARQLWLLCGDQLVRWNNLVAIFNRVLESARIDAFPHASQRKHGESSLSLSRYESLKDARNSMGDQSRSLIALVKIFGHHDCIDQRDKLFGLRGLASNGDRCEVDYSKTIPYIFLRSLSSEAAKITRGGPKSRRGPYYETTEGWKLTGSSRRLDPYVRLNRSSQKLSNCVTLCSTISMTESEVCGVLRSGGNHSMLEWLTYEGTVSMIGPTSLRQALKSRFSEHHKVNAWDLTIASRLKQGVNVKDDRIHTLSPDLNEIRIISPSCRNGDLIYSLDLGTADANFRLLIVFRFEKGCFKAVEIPFTTTFLELSRSKAGGYSTYLALRRALVGRIQLCKASARVPPAEKTLNKFETWRDSFIDHSGFRKAKSDMLQASTPFYDVALAHISYYSMLVLTALCVSQEIPEYLKDPDLEGRIELQLCKGGEGALLDVQTSSDGMEQVLHASWSCCYGSE